MIEDENNTVEQTTNFIPDTKVMNTVSASAAGQASIFEPVPVNMTFLTNEQNLTLMKPDADLIDNHQPYSGFAIARRREKRGIWIPGRG